MMPPGGVCEEMLPVGAGEGAFAEGRLVWAVCIVLHELFSIVLMEYVVSGVVCDVYGSGIIVMMMDGSDCMLKSNS